MSDDLTRAIAETLDRRHHLNTADLAAHIAAALAPLIEARVREAQGPCTCPPWHPDKDGPEEDCAQHGRPYAYWVEYAGVLEGRISDLLCDLTGGLLSKPGYDVPTMVQAVEEHFERTVVAVAWDEGYTSGHSNAMRRMSDEPNAPTTPNPYRAEEVRRG